MNKKFFRLADVLETCDVSAEFIQTLEEENLIKPIRRRRLKLYPIDQVDRVRVANILVGEMGVNLAGVEVALHMRDQIIRMRREIASAMRRVSHVF
ncbi:MAG TPA: chaperone modulator CbpM [Candidatus Binatia bacterium]|jgi:MerR family transcriptional regulator/heat shock protein HspR